MKTSYGRAIASGYAPLLGVLLLAPALVGAGDSILLKNGKVMAVKSIQWREGAREYQVEAVEGDIKMPIALKDVERLDIARPADFDKAQQLVSGGNAEAAIPLLEGVLEKYRMLVWDAKAREVLGRVYLQKKNAAKALEVLKPLFADVPVVAVSGNTRRVYWEALAASGRGDDLRKELDQAIATGRRDIAAAAQVMRGNLLQAAGKNDEALSDYLRTVLFFEEIKDVQPEALFKAAEGLKERNDSRAQALRKTLLQKYPDSDFAKKLSEKAG